MQGDKKPKKIKPTILNLRKRKLTKKKKKKGVDVLKYNLKNKNKKLKKLYTEFFFQKPNITLYYDPLYLFCSFFNKLIF